VAFEGAIADGGRHMPHRITSPAARRKAALIAAAMVAAAAPSPAGARTVAPRHGALLGIYAKQRAGRTHGQELRHVERQLHRRLAIDHFYVHFDDSLADRQVRATIRRGRIPLINWSPEGAAVSWGRIAAGAFDHTIERQARALRHLGAPVMLAFSHEPENDSPGLGTPGQFKSAFRHIVARFRAAGARNVRFVCILEGYTYDGGNGGVRQWYPGRRWVNWAGADAYNWAPGRAGYAWRSFKDAFRGFNRWGRTHHKPLIVAEFGTQERPGRPSAKAHWFASAARTIKKWHRIKAAVYFNSNSRYRWWIDTSRPALRAFRALADAKYFRP
jgi:hypothetical protein